MAKLFLACLFIFCSAACSNHLADFENALPPEVIPSGTEQTPETPTTPENPETPTTPESPETPTSPTTPEPATPTTPAVKYNITVTSSEHGTLSVDKTSAAAGERVLIIAIPDVGYRTSLVNVKVSKISDSSPVEVTDYSFIMPEDDVNIKVNFQILRGAFIYKIVSDTLGGASTATQFLPSTTAPTGNEIELYSLPTGLRVYAWLDGTTIYYYAAGYTDSNKKIPLLSIPAYLFMGSTSLQKIDLSYFDTSDATDMSWMFYDCKELREVNLSSFETSNVTTMYVMFGLNTKLEKIIVGSGFDTSNVTNSERMFVLCSKLVGGAGTTYDENHIDKEYARIDGGPSNPGYFTSN